MVDGFGEEGQIVRTEVTDTVPSIVTVVVVGLVVAVGCEEEDGPRTQ